MNQFHTREKQSMASKLNMMTFLHQVRGLAEVAKRCPQPSPPARFTLLARRSPAVGRRKWTLSIDMRNLQDNPSSVSITHVKETTPPPALSN
jgi:hypothetical protein